MVVEGASEDEGSSCLEGDTCGALNVEGRWEIDDDDGG